MKARAIKFLLPMMTVAFFSATAADRVEENPMGHARDFTSETYYDHPHEQQVKVKLSGAEASPLPGGLMNVKQLRIEMYDVDGKVKAIVKAPQCNYSPFDDVASSAGHIEIETGDGKIHVEGNGFLWRQEDNSLTISNNVLTTIKPGFLKPGGL